jgi:hypothetical protein
MREGLGMKYFDLRWLARLLTSNENNKHFEVTKVMIQQLAIHVHAGFQHLLADGKL